MWKQVANKSITISKQRSIRLDKEKAESKKDKEII